MYKTLICQLIRFTELQPCNYCYLHESYNAQFVFKLLVRCGINCVIILEDVVCGAVEQYCVLLFLLVCPPHLYQ